MRRYPIRWLALVSLVTLVTLVTVSAACANKRTPILVGQSGVLVAESIGKLQQAIADLEQAETLSTEAALAAQETLLLVNSKLKPLPDLLRAIDAAQQAGEEPDLVTLDEAIGILQEIAPSLSTVVRGVPLGEAADGVVALVRAAQETLSTVLIQVARIKGV